MSVNQGSRASSVNGDAKRIDGVETVPLYVSAAQGPVIQLMERVNVHQVKDFSQQPVKETF